MLNTNNIKKVRRVLRAYSGSQTPIIKPITRLDLWRQQPQTISTMPKLNFNQGFEQRNLTYWDQNANNGKGGIAFTNPNNWITLPQPVETDQLVEQTADQPIKDKTTGTNVNNPVIEADVKPELSNNISNWLTTAGVLTGSKSMVNIGQAGQAALSISDQIKNLKGLKGISRTAGIGGIAGTAADAGRNLLFSGVHDDDSHLTSGLNNMYDSVSSSLMGFSPVGTIVGGAMKVGGFVGDALSSMGVGTDQMTTTDQILDSNFMKLTPVGLVNAIGAKRTQSFSADQNTIAQVGNSYGGSVDKINNAVSKAGKKYGLLSSGSRRRANRQIDTARGQQNIMAGIASEATDRASMAANMSDINHLAHGFNLNGGYDQRYMRAAKLGTKLQRIKKLNLSSYKIGGNINGTINVETKEIEWKPIITEPIEQFEEGGKITSTEWVPIITLQDGGKAEKVDGTTGAAPKITFESWYNLIPKDRNDTTQYNLRRAFELAPMEELEAWRTSSIKDLKDGKNHLNSVYFNPDTGEYEFMKSKNHPTLKYELEWYNSDDSEAIQFREKYDLDTSKDYYKYVPKKFKSGGKVEELEAPEIEDTEQKNIIPEGALHARKHNMENDENITKKGIPVIDDDGEQQAEIEREEIIFTLEVTKKLEELYANGSDKAAIEAGKLLVKEILFNTDDRTGLINTLKQGGVIDELS